jgi:WD40 repeat protein
VAYSPDGKLVASGAKDWSVRLWEPATGKEVRTILPGENRNHVFVEGVTFSPDSKHVAAVGDPDTVTVWEAATGKEVWNTEGKGIQPSGRGHFGVAFSPDGKRLAVGSENGSVKVWDTTTWAPLPALKGHLRKVLSVAFSPDGFLLASGGQDGTVRLWLAATGQELQGCRGAAGVWPSAPTAEKWSRRAATTR